MSEPKFVRIGWWNTRLSPRKAAPNLHLRSIAAAIIGMLFQRAELDVLLLGEVSQADLAYLRAACGAGEPLAVLPTDVDEGRHAGLGALVRTARLGRVTVEHALVDELVQRQRRFLGLHLALTPEDQSQEPLHIFATHWPSRAWAQVQKRKEMAHALRDWIERLSTPPASTRAGPKRSTEPALVVLGDLNDEPFDESVASALRSSREREFVRRHPSFLYNPCWRLLGESRALEDEKSEAGCASGSCMFSSGEFNRWHLIDQLLVSSALLRPPGKPHIWSLRERELRYWREEPLFTSAGRFQADFDHFPLLGTVEHRTES